MTILSRIRRAALVTASALAITVATATAASADPISALVAGAGALLGLGSAGTALLQIGAAVGLSLLSRSLTKKKTSSTTATQGGRSLSLTIDTNAPRQAIFGRTATAGSLVYWQCVGANNSVLQMVVALADHECQGLAGLWVDGKYRAWNSTTKEVDGYGSALKVRFYNGTGTQTVDEGVRDASGGRWTNAEIGAHVCYAVIEATANETLFSGGIPEISFVIDGAKLYDPRLDSTAGGSGSHRWGTPSTYAFTANPAIIAYNLLRGFYPGGKLLLGLEAPADTVRLSDLEASANICDEPVPLLAGGTEPRYRCGFVVTIDPSGQPNRDALETAREAMGGEVVCSGGIYRILAGAARASVATLTDAGLISDAALSLEPRRPRSELSNAVTGSFSNPDLAYQMGPLPERASSVDEEQDGGIRLARDMSLDGVTSRTQGQRLMEMARKRARRQAVVRGTWRAQYFGLEPGDWVTLNSSRLGYAGQAFEIESASVNPDLTTELTLREVDASIDDWVAGDEIDDETSADLPGGAPTLTSVPGLSVSTAVITGDGDAQWPALRAEWTPITDPTASEILFEYRKLGDTVALEKRALIPSSGALTWVEGIQGGIQYQVRALLITRPERATTWTAWATTPTAAADVVVQVAASALSIPPELIPPAELSAQERLELRIATATADMQGSVAARLEEIVQALEAVSESTLRAHRTGATNATRIRTEQVERVTATSALAQQITTILADLGDATAAIATEQTARIDGDAALASSITTISTEVDGNSAAITMIAESVDGLSARWGVAVNSNNQVVGLVQLDGSANGSTFTVVANKFVVAHPTTGTPVPFFTLGDVNGAPNQMVLDGDFIADGTITARALDVLELSAITADLGVVTAGKVQSADGKFVIDLDNKILRMSNT